MKECEAGKGFREISMQLSDPVSSVQSVVKKWTEQGAACNKTKGGWCYEEYITPSCHR